MDDDFHPHFAEPLPGELIIGHGNVLLIQGWQTFPIGREAHYEVHVGDRRFDFPFAPDVRMDVEEALSEGRVAHGFWLPVPIGSERAGRREVVRCSLVSGSGHFVLVEGTVSFVARGSLVADSGIRTPLVVCMTTFEPDPVLFRRQVDSLRAQTFRDWTCIVQDDASQGAVYAEIQSICSQDSRFIVARNDRNLGFYRNFERCLARVPATAEFVALCDQDDVWYPNKLEASLARFRAGITLVYSDMRIVDADGYVLAPSYWVDRKNNFRSLETMLFANTITGAASVMRNDVVRQALPFPEPIGDAYHDNWLACVAMLAGELDYIDRPLYDYIQHRRNVIGYCDFVPTPLLASLGANVRRLLGGNREQLMKELLKHIRTYRFEYRRLALFRHILLLRFPEMPPEKARGLELFGDRWQDALGLLQAHLGVRARGDTTANREVDLGISLAVHKSFMSFLTPVVRAKRRVAPLLGRVHSR